MTRRELAVIFGTLMLIALTGCSTSTDLGGSGVPNSRPDTRLTGQPPSLLEAGYTVEFNWTGTDPDGLVKGYQWKISDNGTDGISPRDTLTIDPLTGAEIHPWHFTTATDTVFFVLADQSDFPGDPAGYERSFRTHSLFVRTVDDKGAVDATPAFISFTSTTIVPTCRGEFPTITQSAISVPSTVNLGYDGEDVDYDLGMPTHVRFLWTEGSLELPDGTVYEITSPYRYNQYRDELIDFEDPGWTDWQRFGATKEERKISYTDEPDGHYFLFAVQVRDTAGAVSIGKDYQAQVLNLRISAGQFRPVVNLKENFLGSTSANRSSNVAAGQPLNFSWTANVTGYNGTLVSMRHGWDIADVDDDNDPGWAVPPGLTEQNRFAEERAFANGDHSFWIKVVDDSGAAAVIKWSVSVIPYVARENQLNMVFVDQVLDTDSGRWGNSPNPNVFYDREEHRNAYWRFLDGVGGVGGFNWARDFYDHSSGDFDYETLVNYKVALISARAGTDQQMFIDFRPDGAVDKFVWLTPYQQKGGNVFLVGSQSMESFLEVKNYMVPIIFDSTVEEYQLDNNTYYVGFGTKELNDGTEILRGPLMYPYATAGIASLDWNVPLNKWIYGRRPRANEDRTASCSGLKELRLVEEFRTDHLIGPGAIADVIPTDLDIDWRDTYAAGSDSLGAEFPFLGDEFVDDKIADRPTAVTIQECDPGFDGKCVEPMLTGVARMDWLREKRWAAGDDAWPGNDYSPNELRTICGEMALTTYVADDGTTVPLGTARTSGKVYGWLSYKTIADKPGGKADVYWGFDPYRFDHAETKKAIVWVMQHFGLPIEQGGPTR